MKTIVLMLFIFVALTSRDHCVASTLSAIADSVYTVEKVIDSVNINGELFSIKVLRRGKEQYEHLELNQLPITLVFLKDAGTEVVGKLPFISSKNDSPIVTVLLFKARDQKLNRPGNLFISFNTSYGGSGSKNYNYIIYFNDGKVQFDHLFESSGELDYIAVNQNNNDLILLEGIWGKGEAHYSNHRYKLKKYNLHTMRFSSDIVGLSRKKYPSLNDSAADLLKVIKLKEPKLLKSINISNY